MTITSEENAVAAFKHGMLFHKRHNVKSVNEIEPHKLSWADLSALGSDTAKTARSVVDSTTDENRTTSEAASSGLIDLLDAIGLERDERSAIGNKEARKQSATARQLSNRPGFDVSAASFGEQPKEAVALRSGQSFRSWAETRSSIPETVRGMSAGAFLRAMVVNNKTDVERRALAEATDSAGGYTVPDVLSADLIDLARAQSVLTRAGAQTVPLTSDKNTIAKLLSDPSPAWRLEAGDVANDDATFGPVVLIPRSLAVKIDISAELMADSLNLDTALPSILAAAMAVELDRVGLIGTGVAPQPLGVANTSGIGTFAQDGPIQNYRNLSKARTGILSANRGPVSAYIMHPRDEGSFVDLSDGTGQPLMSPPAVSAIPMLTTTALPIDGGAGGDESTIIAGNFSHVLVGIRSGIQVELFKGPNYISNLQYTMIAHMRADIAVQDPKAFYTLTGVGQA